MPALVHINTHRHKDDTHGLNNLSKQDKKDRETGVKMEKIGWESFPHLFVIYMKVGQFSHFNLKPHKKTFVVDF